MIGMAVWMLEGLDDRRRACALKALRTSIQTHQTARGVAYGSAAWLVTARCEG